MSIFLRKKECTKTETAYALTTKPEERRLHNRSILRTVMFQFDMHYRIMKLLPAYAIVLSLFILIGIGGSRTITVLSEQAPISNRLCIVIDAGHGGVDGGATSCTGVEESQINLQIALKLRDIMHLLGIKTHMIRTTDTSIHTGGNTISAKKVSDLKERVRIVNETENSILISIHQNYFSQNQYHGAQVFYAATEGSEFLAKQIQNMPLLTYFRRQNTINSQALFL